MPKSISIYIPDELIEKMDEFPEVNWSEIARQAIENYISRRRRYDEVGSQVERHLKEAEYLTYRLQNALETGSLRPIQISRSDQISCESKLRFRKSDQDLDIVFYLQNLSEDDVVLDRIAYAIELTAQDGSVVEAFTGGYLRRMILRRGQQFSCVEKLRASVETLQKLGQMASKNEADIKWELLGEVFFDSRKGFVEVKLGEHDRPVHII